MKQLFLSMNLCVLSFGGMYAMNSEEDPCMGSPEQRREEIRRSWAAFNSSPDKEEFLQQKAAEMQEKFSLAVRYTQAQTRGSKIKK